MIANTQRFWAKVDKRGDAECWPWLGGTKASGRGVFWECLGGNKGKFHAAPKVVVFLAPGTLPELNQGVLHSCDNPNCVNPAHLRYGTQKENINDAIVRGRYKKPPARSKIDSTQAHEIRSAWILGVKGTALAELFGLTKQGVYEIINGNVWVSA